MSLSMDALHLFSFCASRSVWGANFSHDHRSASPRDPIITTWQSLVSYRDLQGDSKHTLLITTERLQFVAMVFDESSRALRTVATGDLRDRIGRQIDRGQIFAADPMALVVAMQFYEGHLKVGGADFILRPR